MERCLGIITGAAGGIGRATAERFAAEGWSLVLTDVDDSVHAVAKELPSSGDQKMVGVVADLTKQAGVSKVDATVKKVGQPLRFLGLIAGTLQKVWSLETIELSEWDRVMDLNVKSMFFAAKSAIPHLRRSGRGCIVNVGSISSFVGQAVTPVYTG